MSAVRRVAGSAMASTVSVKSGKRVATCTSETVENTKPNTVGDRTDKHPSTTLSVHGSEAQQDASRAEKDHAMCPSSVRQTV